MITLIWVFLVTFLHTVSSYNYCSVTPNHTLCGYTGVPRDKCLNTKVYTRGLSERDKKQILDYHNKLRSALARGRTRQPGASDMLQLSWDEELAWEAQAHADTCRWGHDCSSCRRLQRWRAGQNLYQSYSTQFSNTNWKKALDAWFWDEINLFPVSSVYRYRHTSETGHFSQMAWAKTSRVGCGLTEYRTNNWVAKYYVCNYGEGGNVITLPVYSTGPACSRCPANTSCSLRYPGLCSEINFNV